MSSLVSNLQNCYLHNIGKGNNTLLKVFTILNDSHGPISVTDLGPSATTMDRLLKETDYMPYEEIPKTFEIIVQHTCNYKYGGNENFDYNVLLEALHGYEYQMNVYFQHKFSMQMFWKNGTSSDIKWKKQKDLKHKHGYTLWQINDITFNMDTLKPLLEPLNKNIWQSAYNMQPEELNIFIADCYRYTTRKQSLEDCLITMFSELEAERMDDLYTKMTFTQKSNHTYDISLWTNKSLNHKSKFVYLLWNYTYKSRYRCYGTLTDITYEYGYTNNRKDIRNSYNKTFHDRSWHFSNESLNLLKIINKFKDNKKTRIHIDKDYTSIVWAWEPTPQPGD